MAKVLKNYFEAINKFNKDIDDDYKISYKDINRYDFMSHKTIWTLDRWGWPYNVRKYIKKINKFETNQTRDKNRTKKDRAREQCSKNDNSLPF